MGMPQAVRGDSSHSGTLHDNVEAPGHIVGIDRHATVRAVPFISHGTDNQVMVCPRVCCNLSRRPLLAMFLQGCQRRTGQLDGSCPGGGFGPRLNHRLASATDIWTHRLDNVRGATLPINVRPPQPPVSYTHLRAHETDSYL